MNYNIVSHFFKHSQNSPEALAASASGRESNYSDFADDAQKISRWLDDSLKRRPQRVGILGSRSVEACIAAYGVNWAGGAFVPISLKAPLERLKVVFEVSELDALIVDDNGAPLITEELLVACPDNILVFGSGLDALPQNKITRFSDLPKSGYQHPPVQVEKDDTAYIIFTSGTTGVPKGVVISQGSIMRHVQAMLELQPLTREDRVAQVSELSFDVALSNMFMALSSGACLHIVPASQAMAPAAFIREREITYWYSVPSAIHFMQSMRMLKPGAFPSIKYSMFTGEPLPLQAALAWQEAAPNSVVDNTYGPTEGTVNCVSYRLPKNPPYLEQRGIMAFGKPFPGSKVAVVDEKLNFLPPNVQGEIALAGEQVAMGYFRREDLSQSRFPVIGGERWYLTGDSGLYDEDGIFYHHGRIDNQVKILGYRVELEDIESHIRAVAGVELAAAVAWPVHQGAAAGVVGFVSGSTIPVDEIREALKLRLPTYMVPGVVYEIKDMPVNANGKVDRKALLARLQAGL